MTIGDTQNSNAPIAIGSHVDDTNSYAELEVAELVAFDTAVSNSEREKMEGYLAHKYGLTADLPAGHTYKTTPP